MKISKLGLLLASASFFLGSVNVFAYTEAEIGPISVQLRNELNQNNQYNALSSTNRAHVRQLVTDYLFDNRNVLDINTAMQNARNLALNRIQIIQQQGQVVPNGQGQPAVANQPVQVAQPNPVAQVAQPNPVAQVAQPNPVAQVAQPNQPVVANLQAPIALNGDNRNVIRNMLQQDINEAVVKLDTIKQLVVAAQEEMDLVNENAENAGESILQLEEALIKQDQMLFELDGSLRALDNFDRAQVQLVNPVVVPQPIIAEVNHNAQVNENDKLSIMSILAQDLEEAVNTVEEFKELVASIEDQNRLGGGTVEQLEQAKKGQIDAQEAVKNLLTQIENLSEHQEVQQPQGAVQQAQVAAQQEGEGAAQQGGEGAVQQGVAVQVPQENPEVVEYPHLRVVEVTGTGGVPDPKEKERIHLEAENRMLLEKATKNESFAILGINDKNRAFNLFKKSLSKDELDNFNAKVDAQKFGSTNILESEIFDSVAQDINQKIAISSGAEDVSYATKLQPWVKGSFGSGTKKNLYSTKSFGVTVGANADITEELLIGASYSFKNINYKYKAIRLGDKSTAKAHIPSIYVRYKITPEWDVRARGSFGYVNIDSTRTVSNTLHPKSKSSNIMSNLELSTNYDLNLEQFKVTPTLGFEYTNTKVGGYKEDGGSLANMDMKKYNRDTFSTKLNLFASAPDAMKLGDKFTLTPSLNVGVKFNLSSKPLVHTKFAWSEENYNKNRYSTHGFEYNLGAGLVGKYNNLEVGLGYNNSGHKNYCGHQGSINAKLSF